MQHKTLASCLSVNTVITTNKTDSNNNRAVKLYFLEGISFCLSCLQAGISSRCFFVAN